MENIFDDNKIAVIGDKFAQFLQSTKTVEVDDLVDYDMTMRLMFKRLQTQDTFPNVEHLLISIGSKEYFSNIMDVTQLCNLLKDIFPNAYHYAIEGFLLQRDVPFLSEDEIKDIENVRNDFYDEFEANNFYVIGTGKLISQEPLDRTNTKINKIKDFIGELKFIDNFSKNKNTKTLKKGDPFIKNVDISGEDVEDFSTIYDFLDRLQEIVDSGNTYKKDNVSRYNPDVHQIEIALAFLIPSFTGFITEDGIYDEETELMVKTFQRKNSLPQTGIADSETIEKLFYDIKIKGFDEEDLLKYINKNEIKIPKNYPIDNIDFKEMTDLLIDNIEGGYANEAHFKASAVNAKDPDLKDALEKSSETMFGLDRKNGGWDSHPIGSEFFTVVDENSGWAPESAGKDKWPHGFMGGDVEGLLRNLATETMQDTFNKNSKMLDPELLKIVMQDKRLFLHFYYGCWNGSGWFEDFARHLNNVFRNGVTDRDELYQEALNSRRNSSHSLVRDSAGKIDKIAVKFSGYN